MTTLAMMFRSCKTELKIILLTLLFVVCLPVIAVIVMADSGLQVISNALAAVDPISHLVQVKDPDGKVVAQLTLSTVWPVKGIVSLEFGQPDPPYQPSHTGIDIADRHGQQGADATPFMAGKVIKADITGSTGWGRYVVIDHSNGITSLYGHLRDITTTVGAQVKPGDVIGHEGSTGNSTGPHVHFEIRVFGLPVNPRTFMVGNPDPGA